MAVMVAAGLILPGGAAAGAEAEAGPPITPVVVRTSSSVHTTIRVEYPVQFFTVSEDPAIRFRSSGDFSGFAIVSSRSKKLAFAGFRVDPCTKRACDGAVLYFRRDGMITESGSGELKPGTYELHVFGDGPWIKFAMRVPGVEIVRPGRFSPTTLGSIDLPEHSGGNAFSAGATFESASPGLVFATTWGKVNPHYAMDIGTCLYEGDPPTEPALAYHSRCDEMGARKYGMSIRSNNPSGSNADMATYVLLTIGEGTYGLGAYSEAVGTQRAAGASAVLIEL